MSKSNKYGTFNLLRNCFYCSYISTLLGQQEGPPLHNIWSPDETFCRIWCPLISTPDAVKKLWRLSRRQSLFCIQKAFYWVYLHISCPHNPTKLGWKLALTHRFHSKCSNQNVHSHMSSVKQFGCFAPCNLYSCCVFINT